MSRVRLLDVVGLLVRLGLAAVWLVSGAFKVLDPVSARRAVVGFDVLPGPLVGPVAQGLPLVELALGTVLLVGAFVRVSAGVSVLLLVVLIAAVAQAWARGLTIDCGCFGGGGQVGADQTRYPREIARDVGFLALAGWLAVRPRTPWSVDSWRRIGAGTTRTGA